MPTVLSKEQQAIVKCMRDGKCCVSDSVPGAGKTTTGIEIARELPDKCILSVTFSSALKAEGRGKVQCIKNIDIESYNSLILQYYGKGGNSKEEVFEILNNDEKICGEIKPYDIIILDEMQDMNILFFQMILKLVRDINIHPQYLVIGDKYQGVFEFLGADRRYLTLAHKILPGEFEKHYLTHSFRMTDTMSQFMNEAVLGEPRIKTNKPSDEKVSYIIADPYDKRLYENIFRIIDKRIAGGAKPDDFFILFAGMKPRTPAPKLNKYLSQKKLLVAFMDSETDNVSDAEMRGKIVMTTFHKSKGRERKYVIVFNVDTSYFKYYKQGADTTICPPEMYVALTRATKTMWIIQGFTQEESYRQCPFFKLSIKDLHETSYCKVVNPERIKYKSCTRMDGPIPTLPKKQFDVTDFIQYLPDNCEEHLYALLNPLFSHKEDADGHQTAIPPIITSHYETQESISDLVGTAIPSYIGHIKGIRSDIHTMLDKPRRGYEVLVAKIKNPPDSIEDHLRFANIQKSVRKGIGSNLRQIKEYKDIVSPENVKCCELNSARITLTGDTKFEVCIKHNHYHQTYGAIQLNGAVDALSDSILTEFKCVGHLKFEHKLQVAVYAWMIHHRDDDHSRDYHLFNFFTGELLQMRYDEYALNEIMDYIFTSKYDIEETPEDSEFIQNCKKIGESYKHTTEYSGRDAQSYYPTNVYYLDSSEEDE